MTTASRPLRKRRERRHDIPRRTGGQSPRDLPKAWRKLPRSFYLQPTLRIARQLLGKILVRRRGRDTLAGRIVEVEAYLGRRDPASHAYRGMTRRNEVMFRKGGHLYVYFTYGMHYCSNVVTGRENVGLAVLLRSVEPVLGISAMIRNRGIPAGSGDPGLEVLTNLCSGPAKLCQSFGVTGTENGTDLCGSEIWIAEDRRSRDPFPIVRTGRIGISVAQDRPWRFVIAGNAFVSRGRPAGQPNH